MRVCGGSAHAQDSQVFLADLSIDELLHDGVGMIADMVGIAVGDNVALMEHYDAIGDLIGALHIVGNNDCSNAELALKFENKLIDDVRANRIQSRCRLVVEQYFRIQCDSAGQGHAFALAAGEIGGKVVLKSVEANHSKLGLDQVFDLAPVPDAAVLADGEYYVVKDAQTVEEGSTLKEEAVVCADMIEIPLAEIVNTLILIVDLARGGTQKCDQVLYQYGLAAAAGANDYRSLALLNVQGDAS